MSGWVTVYNFFQYFSLISGGVTLSFLSLVTIIGLIPHSPALAGYKAIIIALAATNMAFGLTWLIQMPIYTYPLELIYLWADIYPIWVTETVCAISEFLNHISTELLAMSMVYRTVAVLNSHLHKTLQTPSFTQEEKPQWLNWVCLALVAIALPLPILSICLAKYDLQLKWTCQFACFDEFSPLGFYLVDNTEREGFVGLIDEIIFFCVLVVGLPCIYILNKKFKNGQFSEKTMKMQQRLTFAMGILILTHTISFFPELLYGIEHWVDGTTGVFQSIVSLVENWIEPIKAWILFLSVRPILKLPKYLQNLFPTWSKITLVSVKTKTQVTPVASDH